MIDNNREDQKATRAADQLLEERRDAERADDQRNRAEERRQTQTMLNMLLPFLQNAAQNQPTSNQLIPVPDEATTAKRHRTSEMIAMDVANGIPPPPQGGNQH